MQNETDIQFIKTEEINFRALSLGIGLGQVKPILAKSVLPTGENSDIHSEKNSTQEYSTGSRNQVSVVNAVYTPPQNEYTTSAFENKLSQNNHSDTVKLNNNFNSASNKRGKLNLNLSRIFLYPFSLLYRFSTKLMTVLTSIFSLLIPKSRWYKLAFAHIFDLFVVLSASLSVALAVSYVSLGKKVGFFDFMKLSMDTWFYRFSVLELFCILYVGVCLYWLIFKLLVGQTIGHALLVEPKQQGVESSSSQL